MHDHAHVMEEEAEKAAHSCKDGFINKDSSPAVLKTEFPAKLEHVTHESPRTVCFSLASNLSMSLLPMVSMHAALYYAIAWHICNYVGLQAFDNADGEILLENETPPGQNGIPRSDSANHGFAFDARYSKQPRSASQTQNQHQMIVLITCNSQCRAACCRMIADV